MSSRHVRSSLAPLALLLTAILAAGCLGRARTRGTGAPAGVPVADSAAKTVAKDSASVRDSLIVKAAADSAAAARPLSPADSARKAMADSSARADSLAARAVVARKPPAASRPCVLDFTESPPETRLVYQTLPNETITGIGGGFVGHCQGENNRLRADSAEQYNMAGVVNLFGNVVYEEPGKINVVASHATYFTREQRLVADGNVTATQVASGSTFTGPNIEYLRPAAGIRTTSRLIAPNRPTASIIEKDSTGKPGVPITIVANTMTDEGDTLVFAWGNVKIVRSKLTGDGDSASYHKLTERARLIRQARVTNNDSTQPFNLVGDTIDLFSRERTIERVVALHKATASNADFVMQSERIDLRLVDQKLDRAYASGDGTSKATTPQQDLVADSIAIHLPLQRIREVRAIGSAVATGVPDTLKLKSEDRDVLRGDTVVAQFDTSRAVGDTTSKQAKIVTIEAQGNASSLFQVASKLGPSAPPAVNYLRARQITVAFDSGTVKSVSADSSASGVYLEPDSLADTSGRARGARATSGRLGVPGAKSAPVKPGSTPVRPPPKPERFVMTPMRRP